MFVWFSSFSISFVYLLGICVCVGGGGPDWDLQYMFEYCLVNYCNILQRLYIDKAIGNDQCLWFLFQLLQCFIRILI